MDSAKGERPNNYNKGGKQNNDNGWLNPDAAKLMARLISLREFQLLARVEELETESPVPSDWPDMTGIGRDYQSAAAGNLVKVDEVDGLDVLASEGGDGPFISFEEKPSPGSGYEPDDFGDLPFV